MPVNAAGIAECRSKGKVGGDDVKAQQQQQQQRRDGKKEETNSNARNDGKSSTGDGRPSNGPMRHNKRKKADGDGDVENEKAKRVFIYGNYDRYYGYRVCRSFDNDPRFQVFKREWFEGMDCLDVGCNEGLITVGVAERFGCAQILGVDIDPILVGNARSFLNRRAAQLHREERANQKQQLAADKDQTQQILDSATNGLLVKEAVAEGTAVEGGEFTHGGMVKVKGAIANGGMVKEATANGGLVKDAIANDGIVKEVDANGEIVNSQRTVEWSKDGGMVANNEMVKEEIADEGVEFTNGGMVKVKGANANGGMVKEEETASCGTVKEEEVASGGMVKGEEIANGDMVDRQRMQADFSINRVTGEERMSGDKMNAIGGTMADCQQMEDASIMNGVGDKAMANGCINEHERGNQGGATAGPSARDVVPEQRTVERLSVLTSDQLRERVRFRMENFLDARGEENSYDTVLCLSLTKWVHLNWGDQGIIKLFAKILRILRLRGRLVLEVQPWNTYKSKANVSEVAKANYRSIKIFPEMFRDLLLGNIGFRRVEVIDPFLPSTGAGFKRPFYICHK